jgi:hypothetical protein
MTLVQLHIADKTILLEISPATLPVDKFVSPIIFGGDTNVGTIGSDVVVKNIFLIGFNIGRGENSVCNVIYLSV